MSVGNALRADGPPPTAAAAAFGARTAPAQPMRLPDGGLIDRGRPLSFRFDGRGGAGYAGDTLASALLANGVRLVGRSFKYHRPRGVYGIGAEEPNALVRLGEGARAEPNARATQIELFDGLVAASQNRWPSLRFDLMAVNALLAPLFPAGFYYKTFMWPASFWEPVYERVIRRAAGMGAASGLADPDRYETQHAVCDVLVVGGGPSGLAAALAAGRSGARTILVDEAARPGGWLLRERRRIDDAPALDWVDRGLAELAALDNVTVLPRTTAFGYYDHNVVALLERVADHLAGPPPHGVRQRRWTVRAREVVLATGAIERPLVFAGNDRPGVMLAGAARGYVNQYAVLPGRRAVVFTSHDDGYRTALDLHDAGVAVAAVIDPRPSADGALPAAALQAGIECLAGHAVVAARGRLGVTHAVAMRLDGGRVAGEARRIPCDLLLSTGGWSPCIHLQSQSGARPVYDEGLAAFVPGAARQRERSVGAARGRFALNECLADGFAGGAAAAAAAGFGTGAAPPMPECAEPGERPAATLWAVPPAKGGKRFVDVQTDVTVEDVDLAHREGYVSVEHLKRYTTLGMGTDQGKTGNVNGLAILAGRRGEAIAAVGTTTFRPPYTPVALGGLAGRAVGAHFAPRRLTPMDAWHREAGAVMVEAGLWLRPRYYPRPGETLAAAGAREATAVRNGVGLVDISTLGKIDIQGPDAAAFLDRVYTNAWSRLAVGRAKYGLMLREDGFVLDDGTTQRLGPDRFLMTTTTANAVKVMAHLEFYAQVVWPELRVQLTSVSEHWAAMALAGPLSRAVLARAVADGQDVGNAALPHLGVVDARIAGVPVRLARLSYSGERAYEIYAPADYGETVWRALLAAGAPEAIVPYGTEAMNILRIEKGHVAGAELDGRTTAADLGLAGLLSSRKDFIGRAGATRPGLTDPARPRLVGLVPADGRSPVWAGAQIVRDPDAPPPVDLLGHVTSNAESPTLGHPIALALVSGGRERRGERLFAADPVRRAAVPVEIVDPVFVDPAGERLRD